jgi:hypothetical protein
MVDARWKIRLSEQSGLSDGMATKKSISLSKTARVASLS